MCRSQPCCARWLPKRRLRVDRLRHVRIGVSSMVEVTSHGEAWKTRTVRHDPASGPDRPRMSLIVDTSAALALLDADDPAHEACVAVASADHELIVPPLALVEIDYWCRKKDAGQALAAFVGDIRNGAYELASLSVGDVQRALELGEQYRDLDLGLVDASVIALAERLQIARVLTLDRRDFSVVRPRHCAALTLLPA